MRILGSKRERRGARGFSLVEITIAVAILAALTGQAATSLMPATDRMRLRAEVREIVALMGDARTRAITTRQVGVIELDAGSARIFYGEPALVRQLPTMMSLRVTGEEGSRNRQRIVFYPEGSASGGAFEIADRNRSIVVRVDWLTGRISVDEGRANAG
jgi:general secretion pathway protein H